MEPVCAVLKHGEGNLLLVRVWEGMNDDYIEREPIKIRLWKAKCSERNAT